MKGTVERIDARLAEQWESDGSTPVPEAQTGHSS
jgi:hypothetical protein